MPRAVTADIEATLADRAAMVERRLRAAVGELDSPPELRDAIAYALFGGGKMLRPALLVLSCEACGGDAEAALPAAGAVELVHAFSLVHDDLPAMDDDDLRRGRATLHVRSGEAMAILAGDAMLAYAFAMLAAGGGTDALSRDLTNELAGASAAMIVGQVLDTTSAGGVGDDEATVRRIHEHKTGALIRAACRMGGQCAGAGDEVLAALSAYGESVGLMFQIVDDLLDVEQTPEHAGKRTGKDAQSGKRTYPRAVGVDASRQEVRRLCERSKAVLAPLGERADQLVRAADHLARRTR